MTPSDAWAVLDSPLVSTLLFHPRKQGGAPGPEGSRDLLFSVSDGTKIGGRLYPSQKEDPMLVFFHGNGEIAADYDEIAPLYNALGLGLLALDYRGYGKSEGRPKASAMLSDAGDCFAGARDLFSSEGFSGPLWVMGRSLGSASALHVARAFSENLKGLILESGFSQTLPLLAVLGAPPGPGAADPIGNLEKIREILLPTLVIHAEYDHILPLPHGEELFEASGSRKKQFYLVRGANHNDLFWRDAEGILQTIKGFVTGSPRS